MLLSPGKPCVEVQSLISTSFLVHTLCGATFFNSNILFSPLCVFLVIRKMPAKSLAKVLGKKWAWPG